MSNHYESTGTIHLKIEDENKEFVLFVPDESHCVNHQGEKYAVFFSKCLCKAECPCEPVEGTIVPFEKCLNSVKIEFSMRNFKMNTALVDAAMKRSKVDVIVTCKSDGEWKLIGITIPTQPVK